MSLRRRRRISDVEASELHRVVNQEALRRVISALVRLEGGQSAAARLLGMSQGWVSKLMLGRPVKTITHSALSRAFARATPAQRRALYAAVVSTSASRTLRRYDDWLAVQLWRFGVTMRPRVRSEWLDDTGRALPPTRLRVLRVPENAIRHHNLAERLTWLRQQLATSVGPNREGRRKSTTLGRATAVERLHWNEVWTTLEQLYAGKRSATQGRLFDLERSIVRLSFGNLATLEEVRSSNRHDPEAMCQFLSPRGVLAVLRTVEPLTHSTGTGGMERHGLELDHRGELLRFLDVSIERELLLLSRERDIRRAQELTEAVLEPSKFLRRRKWRTQRQDTADYMP